MRLTHQPLQRSSGFRWSKLHIIALSDAVYSGRKKPGTIKWYIVWLQKCACALLPFPKKDKWLTLSDVDVVYRLMWLGFKTST